MNKHRRSGPTIVFAGNEFPAGQDLFGATVSYVTLVQALLLARHPERNFQFINQCWPGKCTLAELRNCWADDILARRPDTLCLMIGIDEARKYLRREAANAESWEQLSPEKYREHYRQVLTRARQAGCRRIILLEPFFIARRRSSYWNDRVLVALKSYWAVIREMQTLFQAARVPLHGLFQRHLRERAPENFCCSPDLPNPTGHMIIAEALYPVLAGRSG